MVLLVGVGGCGVGAGPSLPFVDLYLDLVCLSVKLS